MKTRITTIALSVLTLTACENVSDIYEPSDDIIVSTLQTTDTVTAVPSDTIRFKFLVSTNQGAIRHIDLDVDETAVEKVPEKTTFSLIDKDDPLTVDADGNLSREVSTVVVEYPVVLKSNPEVVKNTYKVVFTATNAAGKTASNFTHVKGSNIRIKTDQLKFMDSYALSKKTRTFFSPTRFKAYSCEDFIGNDKLSEEGADSIINEIELVIGYKYVASDLFTKYRLFSPDSEEAEKFMHSEVGEKNYDRTKMHHCVFYRIEGVGGYELDEEIEKEANAQKKAQLIANRNNLDWEYFDKNVNSDFLDNLDFSNATTFLVVKGGFYALKTQDGRRGVIWLNYLNNWNNPIPVSIRRYAFQAISTEE
ncbi:MAG: hypothetical protein ACI3Y5_03590 [Prevotella sp.]